ncbi:hypothetical protein ACFPRL_29050 [Pseudoclavibacter helvolus]
MIASSSELMWSFPFACRASDSALRFDEQKIVLRYRPFRSASVVLLPFADQIAIRFRVAVRCSGSKITRRQHSSEGRCRRASLAQEPPPPLQ